MYLTGIRHFSLSAIFILGLIILTSDAASAQKTYNRPINGKAALIQKQRAAQQQQLLRSKQIQQQQIARQQQMLRAKQLQQQQYAQQQQSLRAKQLQQQQIARQQQSLRAKQLQQQQIARQQQSLRAKQLQQQQIARQQQMLRAKQLQQQLRAKQIQQQQYTQQQQSLRARQIQTTRARQQQTERQRAVQLLQTKQAQQNERARLIQQQQMSARRQNDLINRQRSINTAARGKGLMNHSANPPCDPDPRKKCLAGNLGDLLSSATTTVPANTTGQLWGSIAYSSLTGSSGYSFNYPTQAEAEQAVLNECGPDCLVVVSFSNGCGALAVGDSGMAWGVHSNLGIAQQTALNECSVYGNCEIVAYACTDRRTSMRSNRPVPRAFRAYGKPIRHR